MKKIITYGTYDLLHYGHINLLQRAKALVPLLVPLLLPALASLGFRSVPQAVRVPARAKARVRGMLAAGRSPSNRCRARAK